MEATRAVHLARSSDTWTARITLVSNIVTMESAQWDSCSGGVEMTAGFVLYREARTVSIQLVMKQLDSARLQTTALIAPQFILMVDLVSAGLMLEQKETIREAVACLSWLTNSSTRPSCLWW